jgi:hypothetical protein
MVLGPGAVADYLYELPFDSVATRTKSREEAAAPIFWSLNGSLLTGCHLFLYDLPFISPIIKRAQR